MYDSTKSEVLHYIQELTTQYRHLPLDRFTAIDICDHLQISRNLASQYLNTLFKEGELIKIQTRPVYFFHKESIESQCYASLSSHTYLSIKEFMNEIEQLRQQKSNFKQAVGWDGSLSYCMEQCIMAISYPDHGLPILITGENGVGKSFFCELLCEYAIDHHLILSNKNIYKLDCVKYYHDQTLLLSFLQTYMEEEQKETTIFVIEDLHVLSIQSIEMILHHMNGYLEKKEKKNGRYFIFTSSSDLDVNIKQRLSRKIPVMIQIPSLSNRGMDEKEALIYYFYQKESERIHRTLYLSSSLYQKLLHHTFKDNVSGMRNAIQLSVANAFVNHDGKQASLSIYLYHLPHHLLNNESIDFSSQEQTKLLCLDMLKGQSQGKQILAHYDQILQFFQAPSLTQKELSQGYTIINSYLDFILFDQQHNNQKKEAIHSVCKNITESMMNHFMIYLPSHFYEVVAECVYHRLQFHSTMKKWEEHHQQELAQLSIVMENQLSKEAHITKEFLYQLNHSLDIQLGIMETFMFTLTIHIYNHDMKQYDTLGIILAHGFSTASSIADVTNRMLAQHIFEAIDMPMDVQVPEIAERVKKTIAHHHHIQNLILLVDMGSLQDLGHYLKDLSNINIGIANNISTGLALEIGYKIREQCSLQALFAQTCDHIKIEYHILENKKKQKAILFTSENSESVNERIVELFKLSLPKETKLTLLPCDYKRLLNKGIHDAYFDTYDVLLICGTMDPNIESIPFLPLDSIISSDKIDAIASALYPYLEQDEKLQFKNNLLVNFSIQNVVGYLTILDAKKVLHDVNDAVNLLQNRLHINIDFRTSIGLFIHLSCMIERLVTKSIAEEDMDPSQFSEQERYDMDIIRSCFTTICNHYKIRIPLYEIMYIYDYVHTFQ